MERTGIIVLHVLLLFGTLCLGNKNMCPKLCRCVRHKAYCVRRWNNLTYIPSLPPYITYLKFQGNDLQRITRDTFAPIKANKITYLSMSNNRVLSISEDALHDLTSLKSFSFSHEIMIDAVQVERLLYSVSRSIETIAFTNMHWRTLPNLDGLINTTIKKVDFSFNYLPVLDGSHFVKLQSLRTLDLSYNGINNQNYSFDGLQRITNLYLAGNWFLYFPNFTDMQQLERLHMQNTKISHFEQRNFEGLEKLRYLNLNGHAIRKLYNNTFSTLHSLQTLELRRLAGQLNHIEPYAFNSSSLRNLSLKQNYFDFSMSRLAISDIFAHAPNLANLDLSFNNIWLNESEFLTMISPLGKLIELNLANVKFTFLSNDFLHSLTSLRYLYLSQNSITSWDGNGVFGNYTSLRVLDLSYNGIAIINESSFPVPMRNKLKVLKLQGNPFSCFCNDIEWFYKWTTTSYAVKLLDMDKSTDGYICSSPSRLYKKQIHMLAYRDVCPIDPTLLKVIIACGTMIGSVLLILGTVYKCRWNIRYRLFKFNQKRKRRYRKDGYDTIPRENDYLYDCFPVYADEDLNFVRNKLTKILEDKHHRKLCIRDRDFVLGNVFIDSITESIENSRKVLLLISNNFARSRWCHFQLQMALHRMAEESKNLLVIVLLQEISYKYFTNTLKTVLVTCQYISWANEGTAERMFWDKLLQEVPPSHTLESIVEEADNDIIVYNQ